MTVTRYILVIWALLFALYIPFSAAEYLGNIHQPSTRPISRRIQQSIRSIPDLSLSVNPSLDFHSPLSLEASDDDDDGDSPDFDTVNRTHCPNKCSKAGRCLNVTHPTDPSRFEYRCDCGFPSDYKDCSDTTRLPWYYTVFLTSMALFFLFVILYFFQKCNRALETRQNYYTPHQRLKNQGITMKPDI